MFPFYGAYLKEVAEKGVFFEKRQRE